jgi:hypothetical protein
MRREFTVEWETGGVGYLGFMFRENCEFAIHLMSFRFSFLIGERERERDSRLPLEFIVIAELPSFAVGGYPDLIRVGTRDSCDL